MQVRNGDTVRVRTYGGKIVTRRLVEVRDRVALVTTDEELQRANKEGREPVCIGFPVEDIVEREKIEH
jgi:hypothetical protein